MKKSLDTWVYIETDRNGKPLSVGQELLRPGRDIARGQGGTLTAVVLGCGIHEAVKAANQSGADRVIYVDDPALRDYNTALYTQSLFSLIRKYEPEVVIIGATPNGRDLAPRLSCRLGTGLTADCTALSFDSATGCVEWVRPAMGGSLMATIVCPQHHPQMGTVRPGVFKRPTRQAGHAELISESFAAQPDSAAVQILEYIFEEDGGEQGLADAEIIVSGGRGLGSAEGFALLRELAEALGGVVGASRAAVDSGWIGHSHQVGQTGATVTPKLYIACGISGAIQHTVAIGGAEKVIAINSDPGAPIFQHCDLGIVGDLYQVLPPLIEKLRHGKDAQRICV